MIRVRHRIHLVMIITASAEIAACHPATAIGQPQDPQPLACEATCAPSQHCDSATAACVCDNACTPGSTACDPESSTTLGTCTQDPTTGCYATTATPCPTGQHCDAASAATPATCTCDTDCVLATTTCDPAGSNQLGTCLLDAATGCRALSLAPCADPNQVCPTGAAACACPATPICTTGTLRCSPDASAIETCAPDAQGCLAWAPSSPCPAHDTCSPTAGPSGTPACICANECSSPSATLAMRCGADPAAFDRCDFDATGCHYWAARPCALGGLCDPSKIAAGVTPACSCPSPPACTVNDWRCSADGHAEQCKLGTTGCAGWTVIAACEPSLPCQMVGSFATCPCPPAAGCDATTTGQNLCVADGGTEFHACRFTSACYRLGPLERCPLEKVCTVSGTNGMQGICKCPPAPCVANSGSCSPDKLTLTRCLRDIQGCESNLSVTCATLYGPGSTCSITTVGARCSCPAPAPGTLYVDRIEGDDTGGTGAASPPRCALSSLSTALSKATSGTTIFARPGVYGAGESFPLTLKSGVTLTTAAPPTSPTEYIIRGSGTCPVLVPGVFVPITATLCYRGAVGESATVENFTLWDGGDYALACNGGAPLLSNVTTDNSINGIVAVATCAPSVDNSLIHAYNYGLHVLTTAGTTSVSHSHFIRGATGIYHEAGALSLLDIDITNPNQYGLQSGPTSASATSPVTLAATDLRIHGGYWGGLVLWPQGTYGAVTIAGADVSGSSMYGVEVHSPSAVLSQLHVHDNVVGIVLSAAGATFTLVNSQVTYNEAGVSLGEGASTLSGVTVAHNTDGPGLVRGTLGTGSITDCVFTDNGGPSYLLVGSSGGVVLAPSNAADLTAFTGNLVYANLGNGIDVLTTGIKLGGADCGSRNTFTCSGAGASGVHVAVAAGAGVAVDAGFNSWLNASPSTGVDYSGTVTTAGACSAAPCP